MIDYNDSLLDETSNDTPYDLRTHTFSSKLQDVFKLGADHTFRLGVDYKHQTFVYGYRAQLSGPIAPKLEENNFAADAHGYGISMIG